MEARMTTSPLLVPGAWATALAAALALAGCAADVGAPDALESTSAPLTIGTAPTPLGPHGSSGGTFSHCTGDMAEGFISLGTVYYPTPRRTRCGTYVPDLDVVLVRRALGSSAGSYAPLGEHLASHGYVVAVLQYTDLAGAMDYLHDHFPLSGRVGLFGHSRGGLEIGTRVGDVEDGGDDVRAVVLLNPVVARDGVAIDAPDLDAVDGLLAIHSVQDNDPGTWGDTVPGDSRESVWRVADRVADRRVVGDVDLVFVPGAHYIQGGRATLGYTTAFLDAHLRGSIANRTYFSVQSLLPNLSNFERPVGQFHRQSSDHIVSDFDAHALAPTPGPGMTIVDTGSTYDLDDFSPHHTRAVRARRLPGARAPALHFNLPAPVSTYSSRYVSFRASQIYDPKGMTSGDPVELRVQVCSGTVCATESVGDLNFPIEVNPLTVASTGEVVDATKNGMRTFTVRLSSYEDAGVDLTGITRVSLLFEPGSTRDFWVDDVEIISPFAP